MFPLDGKFRIGVNCVHNFDCLWHLDSTVGKCFTFCSLDVCGRTSTGENARNAQSDECLIAGVHVFSSPTVKPGHGFMFSSVTLEVEYLVAVVYRTETSVC